MKIPVRFDSAHFEDPRSNYPIKRTRHAGCPEDVNIASRGSARTDADPLPLVMVAKVVAGRLEEAPQMGPSHSGASIAGFQNAAAGRVGGVAFRSNHSIKLSATNTKVAA